MQYPQVEDLRTRQQFGYFALENCRRNRVGGSNRLQILARVLGQLAVVSGRAVRIDPASLAEHANAAVSRFL
ncbi:MAG TPA: hypothetical protein VGU23_06445, partial [Acidobacteriaceae bacterium]|nr:hypothetical protein [Acidobacteriaceae bacterium]